jgi:hypothetical protein
VPVAIALCPTAVEKSPLATLDCPAANAKLPVARAPTARAEEAMPVATGGGRLKLLTPVKPSCETVATSLGAVPGATLTIRRKAVEVPTETVLA